MGRLRAQQVDAQFKSMSDGREVSQVVICARHGPDCTFFFLTTLLGGAAFVLLGQRGMDNLPIVLSFGGAFVLGMSFLHLVPEASRRLATPGCLCFWGFSSKSSLK